jgi:lipoyl(octanoyl) transferase
MIVDAPGTRTLEIRRLGRVPYAEALELQSSLVARRRTREVGDTLLLMEHPHVLTLGTGASTDHVLLSDAERGALGIDLFETGRGGDVTYHGPGQLVGYPILDLRPDRCDLHRYLRDLEQVLIDVARDFGLEATRAPGLTGVWIEDRKIAAIGVRVSSGWITSHGFALNVATDLRYFETIVPCGIADRTVSSLGNELGRALDPGEVRDRVEQRFRERFGYIHPV